MSDLFDLLIFVVFLAIGYGSGTYVERKHLRSLAKREREIVWLPATTMRGGYDPSLVERAWLVTGSAAISTDYFKSVAGTLRNIVGGRLVTFEGLLDRARREAILRMKYEAESASMIVNIRVETSMIGDETKRRGGVVSVEALAYGTAIQLRA